MRPRGWLGRRVDRAFEATRRGYTRALDATLRFRPGVYLVWIVLSVLVIPMYMFAPKELAPVEDQGVVFGALDVPANASLEQIVTSTEEVNRIYMSEPEAQHSFQVSFPTGGFGGMLTRPWTERTRSIFQIQEELARKLQTIPGVRAPAFLPPALPNPGLFPVEFVIASTADHAQMMGFAQQLVDRATQAGLFAFPPVTDVKIDQQQAELIVDRDKVAAMGQTMQQLGADLSAILGGNFVNRFNLDGRSYKVIPQIQRIDRLTPEQLTNIYVSGPAGKLVPLSAVATLRNKVVPRTLNRFQQLNAIKISGVTTRSLEQALALLEDTAAQILPQGYRVDYTGESRQLRQEGGKFLPAIGLALLLIFLVLAAQFNSFRDPFVILAGSVPLAMFGAMLFTFLKFQGPPGLSFGLTAGWTTTLNIYSQVGLVTLAGLVAKNGILIVQFANTQQAGGATKLEAVREAARIRLRPILMVTAATVAGHFPLTLVSGPGAAARNSIGLVLVGGMMIGTVFTLFVVPSLYILIARDHRRDRERLGSLSADPAAPDPPDASRGSDQ
jgi:multidrug efflux pump